MPKEWHARFNLVLSFNALHWVKDHHLFLQQAHHVCSVLVVVVVVAAAAAAAAVAVF